MQQPAAQSGLDRVQRTLGVMAATVFGLTALSVVALLILRVISIPQSAYASGPLQVLVIFPLPGLAITLLLVIALIVIGAIVRTRRQRG